MAKGIDHSHCSFMLSADLRASAYLEAQYRVCLSCDPQAGKVTGMSRALVCMAVGWPGGNQDLLINAGRHGNLTRFINDFRGITPHPSVGAVEVEDRSTRLPHLFLFTAARSRARPAPCGASGPDGWAGLV